MSFMKVILSGTLATSENWSCSVAYRESVNVATHSQQDLQAAATAIATVDLGNDIRTVTSGAVRSTLVRVEHRADEGTLLGAAEAAWTKLTSAGATATKPAQTALVFSLRTGVPGARHRGRIYWPALAATIDSATLRLTAVATAAYATQMAAYLDLIETQLKEKLEPSPSLIDYALAVYSQTNRALTDVNLIQVGDILDVQRRRRDSLPEAYSSANYP